VNARTAVASGAAALLFALPPAAAAQGGRVAFVNVNVIAMDRDGIQPFQTVLIDGELIAAVGSSGDVEVPGGTTVIDGTGQYLTPGLVDSHVHLEGGPFWQGARANFGDAGLYLSHGVTSVLNLRGTPEFLEWRRRIREGSLQGPTIYTAGEFIIGPGGPTIRGPSGEVLVAPNAQTPADVQRAVAAQAAAGVDAVKYYGGLSRDAYRTLTDAVEQLGIPLIGHSPDHLGVDEWLSSAQSLAHIHQLTNLYFFPPGALFAHLPILLVSAVSLLLVITIGGGTAASLALAVMRGRAGQPHLKVRIAAAAAAVFAAIVAFISAFGSYVQTTAERVAFTAAALAVAGAVVVLIVRIVREWRQMRVAVRLRFAAASAAGLVLTYAFLTFWIPIAWRGTHRDITQLAERIRSADITVQTTLVVWSAESAVSALNSPAFGFVAPPIRARWRSMGVDPAGYLPPPFLEFQQKVANALNEAGVRLVAGTDALGAPFIVPGLSLHEELRLLVNGGLTPYNAIRTATVNAAQLLRKSGEFGTIEVGKRADLLLLDSNPLDDVTGLSSPRGVMVRGEWLPQERLDTLLALLD